VIWLYSREQLPETSEPNAKLHRPGIAFFVDAADELIAMRKELAAHLREAPELKLLDADLRHLFACQHRTILSQLPAQ
jgi:hypothetical protein